MKDLCRLLACDGLEKKIPLMQKCCVNDALRGKGGGTEDRGTLCGERRKTLVEAGFGILRNLGGYWTSYVC
jgi:hypothetical protein